MYLYPPKFKANDCTMIHEPPFFIKRYKLEEQKAGVPIIMCHMCPCP